MRKPRTKYRILRTHVDGGDSIYGNYDTLPDLMEDIFFLMQLVREQRDRLIDSGVVSYIIEALGESLTYTWEI